MCYGGVLRSELTWIGDLGKKNGEKNLKHNRGWVPKRTEGQVESATVKMSIELESGRSQMVLD